MHEKLNILIDYLAKDIEIDDKYEREFYKDEDMLVQIEKDTYKQMCDLMEDNTIPFMGIQMEQKKLNGVFKAQVEIIARLSGNGLKDKFLRIMEKGGMVDE